MGLRSGEAFAGERLRLARLAQGYSLDELGEAVATTRQYLHQLEIHAKMPNGEMTEVLAAALGVTTRFFSIQSQTRVDPEQCHFRKQATTPAAVVSQVLARGTLLDMFIERLDAHLTLPLVSFPQISVQSLEDIEQAAERCRAHWGLGGGPITSMMRVVENAGAVVGYFSDISERVDALSMDRRRPFIIRSEAKPAACRLRFDLAHECAHLVMHRGVQTGDRETEGQAHRFASAFLLPRSAFSREFPRTRLLSWPAIFELKLRWKVSARAIIRRAYDLGLISADQYRTGNIHLNKTGQSKTEQYDDAIEPEAPELLECAFQTLEDAHPGSVRRIANSIGLDAAMFQVLVGRPLPESTHTINDPKVYRLYR